MKDSIIIDMKYADYDMIDGSYGVERHHLMGGANRSYADEDGLWVPLSPDHHNSSRIIAQLAYELEMVSTGQAKDKNEAKEMFRKRYGKTFV